MSVVKRCLEVCVRDVCTIFDGKNTKHDYTAFPPMTEERFSCQENRRNLSCLGSFVQTLDTVYSGILNIVCFEKYDSLISNHLLIVNYDS